MALADETLDPARDSDTRTLVDGMPQPGDEPPPLELGVTLGRYLVIEKIGEGGMGVVVRAYDPKLHREVALKRLHRDALDSDGEARLVREAQAMAQLAHPNVITIHDVERTDDGVVMAMEYVEGQTMAQWIAGGPHGWPEVLARFEQAGQGLMAAHRAGLVHRDFKPSNAILGPNGRVRVMDFGLARAEPSYEESQGRVTEIETEALGDRRPSTASSSGSSRRPSSMDISASDSLSVPLTQAGSVMGTPAYMAPEQHRGDVADARSDQYAFCVSLWEALWGERPFQGDFRDIVLAKHQGPPGPPRGSKVPRHLYEALRRGLAAKPIERWPSMTELLEALAHDPRRRRRRWLAAGATVAAVAGVSAAAVAWQGTHEPPCSDAREQLAGTWDDERQAEVAAALQGTDLSYAGATWERTAERLDAYADEWVAIHTEACEATAVRKVQSAALLDRRMQCLRRRRLHLQATIDVLAEADAEVAKTAIQQVMGLPTLDRCSDVEALMAEVPPPEHPQVARAVEEIRDELTRATALTRAARYADARTLLDELHARSVPLEHAPLEAEVLALSARLANLQGDYPRTVEQGTRAYELAVRSGATAVAADAATTLLFVTGLQRNELSVGRAWAASARPLAQRSDPSGTSEAMVLNGLGVLDFRAGEFVDARAHFEHAMSMLEQAGREGDELATTLNHLGSVLDEQGDYAEAEPHFRRALELQRKVFGPEHPRQTFSMDNLALCLQAQGRLAEARDLHLQTLELRERTAGPQHPETALTLNNLGWDYMGLSEPDTAAQHFGQALAVFEAVYGPEHPRVGMAAESLALAEMERGRLDEAEVLHQRALAVRRKALGDDHPNVALSLNGLGELAQRRERYDEAISLHRQALAIVDAKPEGAERYVGDILTSLGTSLVSAGRYDEARPILERALALREAGSGFDPVVLAEVRFQLAQARLGQDEDVEGARALARQALEGLAGAEGQGAQGAREDIEAWLREHG